MLEMGNPLHIHIHTFVHEQMGFDKIKDIFLKR